MRRTETPVDAVRRSIRLATGLSVRVGSFLGLVHSPCDCTLQLIFLTRPVEGCRLCLDKEEVLHAVWFPKTGLPVNTCRGSRSMVEALLQRRAMPFLVTHHGGERGIWQS